MKWPLQLSTRLRRWHFPVWACANFALIALGVAQLVSLENSRSVLIFGILNVTGATYLVALLSHAWFNDWRRSEPLLERRSDPSPPAPRTRLQYRIAAGLFAIGSTGTGLVGIGYTFQDWSGIGEYGWFGIFMVSLPLGCIGFGALMGYFALTRKELSLCVCHANLPK